MTRKEFIGRFGGIYEHSPWVAECAAPIVGANVTLGRVAAAMAGCVDDAAPEMQLELIRAHPDLAGRARIAGELTPASSGEQASAGLDRCTPQEFERFRRLNERYRARFGFPFIMAVRGRDRGEILAAFESRLDNDYATEFATALAEIHRIARLRLEAMELPT